MAEDFNYSASVSADMGDFIQSMKDAEAVSNKLTESAQQLDTQLGHELSKNIRSTISQGQGLADAFKAGGQEAVQASKQIKVYTQALEKASREAADYLAGSNLGARISGRTSAEKEEDRVYAEAVKAHENKINQQIAQERRFIDEAKRYARDYRDSQLGAVKEVTAGVVDGAERRIAAIRRGTEVDTRAAQDSATSALLRAGSEERAYQQAADAKLSYLETFRREGQTLQDVQRDHEAYMNTISNTRYALYDVATTMTVISAATLGATSAGVGLAASYERAFSDVARVSGGTAEQVAALEKELIDLNKVVPESYNEVAKVATLGGQMNVPVEALSKFTDTILMFSSATGVSVEQAASSIGRLAQMTGTASDELENLGSSVYHVGINSVATEDQILNVAEQISATANLAGFANHEIVGLAGAMASLGVAPQMARGASLRVFRNITDAVDEAGAELEAFARVANMSAEDFASAWRSAPAAAFGELLNGMGAVADAGGNMNSILKDLGITQTQDSQVMLMLAQNTDVYAKALDDAAGSYAEGTALQEGFAITAGTLVERLKTLLNMVKATVVQGMEPLFNVLSMLLKPIEMLASGFEKITSTKLGSYLFSLVAGGSAIVGTFALATAVLSRLTGAFLGILRGVSDVNRALTSTAGSSSRMTTSFRILTAELKANSVAARENATAWKQLNLSKAGMVENAGRAGGAIVSLGGKLLKGVAIIGIITTAIEALTWAWDKFSGAAEQRRLDELFGGSGLQDAIAKDTAALEEGTEAYNTFTAKVTESSQHLPEWASQLEQSAGSQGVLGDSVKDTTEAIREQTMAMGDNYRQAMIEALVSDDAMQNVFQKHGDSLKQAGFSLAEAITAGLEDPGEGATRYVDNLINDLRAQESRLTAELNALQMQGINADDAEIERVAQQITVLNDQLAALGQVRREMASSDSQIISDQELYQTQEAIAASGELGDTWREMGDEAELAGEKVRDFSESLFDGALAYADQTEGLWKLIDGLQETGDAFNMASEGGINNMRNLEAAVSQASDSAAGDAQAYVANLMEIYSALEHTGTAGAAEIDFLRQHLESTFYEAWGLHLNFDPARQSMQQVIAELIQTLQLKAELEERNAVIPPMAVPSGSPTMFQKAFGGGGAVSPQLGKINDNISRLKDLQNSIGGATKQAVNYGKTAAKAHDKAARGAGKGAGAAKKAADANKKAAQEVRTFADYASDLNSVFTRATELRYGLVNAQDAVADSLQQMKDRFAAAAQSIKDARQSIRDLQAELGLLKADKSKMEYHLSIALEYGDTNRATQLQAELAKLEADMAGKSNDLSKAKSDLAKAQNENTKSLKGNSEGARQNRADVQALAQSYADQIIQLASTGASQATLEKKTAQLRAEFEKQLTQMGFNRSEVSKYSRSFQDLTTVIAKVPKNVTVKANTNPAIQAFNEFASKSKKKMNEVSKAARNLSKKKFSGPTITPPRVASGGPRKNSILNYMARVYSMSTAIGRALNTTALLGGPAAVMAATIVRTFRAQVSRSLPFQRGGLIPNPDGNYGRIGTDVTPIMATPGEYMIPKKAVDYYGVPFMNALRNMKVPKGGFGGGSGGSINVQTNVGAVTLTAGTIQALAQTLQTHLVIDNKVIAQANGAANVRSSNVGAN